MPFDFDTRLNRRPFHSLKWCRHDNDVLPLPVADMDFATAPAIQEALHRLVDHGALGYACQPPHLRQEVAAFLARRHNWSVSPQTITFLPGVLAGVRAALAAFSQPADAFVTLTPVYPPLFSIGRSMDRIARMVPLLSDASGRYNIDLDRLAEALQGARVLILCNPHNPVGRVFARMELERIAELCLRNDVLMISDEIHADLVLGSRAHIPLGSLEDKIAQHSVTLMAPSKTYNIAGLGLGYAITPNDALRQRLKNAAGSWGGSVTLPAWIAAEAAYSDPEAEAWLDALLAYLRENMACLLATLATTLPDISLSPVEGTFLAWLDCRGLDLDEAPGEFFLREAQVALNEGSMFGPGGEGYVRLNVGCPRSLLREALRRMARALNISSENR